MPVNPAPRMQLGVAGAELVDSGRMGSASASVTRVSWVSAFCSLMLCVAGVRAQGVEALEAPRPDAQVVAEPSLRAPQPAYEAEWLATAPPALVGVDAGIAAPLMDALAAEGGQLGYRLRSASRVNEAAAQMGVDRGRAASPAELWRLSHASGSQASVQARVFAQGGAYVIELTVAMLDGRGPFVLRARTGHVAFLETVRALLRKALPAAGTGRDFTRSPTAPARPPSGVSLSEFEPERRPRPGPEPPPRRLGFALAGESAVGIESPSFYNHLLGARLDVRLSHEVVFGAYLGYANLAGYQGRVNNLVSYAQIEERIRVSDRHKLRVPLRFAAGYVPRNGPVLRMAAGIAHPVSDRFEWGIDLLAPTIWFLPEGKLVTTLNFALEVIFNP